MPAAGSERSEGAEMETSRRSAGQLIAGLGGVALVAFLFLPWFGEAGAASETGWEGQSSTDVYVLLTAAVAVATALGGAGRGIAPGLTANGATMLLGAVCTLLLAWLALGGSGHDNKIGLYLGVVAAAAVAYGGYSAAREEAGAGDRRRSPG
jgi:hypothetical protein